MDAVIAQGARAHIHPAVLGPEPDCADPKRSMARSEGAEPRNFASESNDLQVSRRTVLYGMLDVFQP